MSLTQKRLFAALSLFLLAVFLQVVLPQTYFWYVCRLDLLLIYVAFAGLLGGVRAGFCFGLVAGLFYDLLVGRFIGLFFISLPLVGFLAALFGQKFYKENYLIPITVTALGVFFYQTVLTVGMFLTGSFNIAFHSWLWEVGLAMLANGILAFLLYVPAYKLFMEIIPPPQEKTN